MQEVIRCPHCPCIFFTKTDFEKHLKAFPTAKEGHAERFTHLHKSLEHGADEGGDTRSGWRPSKWDKNTEWRFASEEPRLAMACKASGKVTTGNYVNSLDPSGKYLRRVRLL